MVLDHERRIAPGPLRDRADGRLLGPVLVLVADRLVPTTDEKSMTVLAGEVQVVNVRTGAVVPGQSPDIDQGPEPSPDRYVRSCRPAPGGSGVPDQRGPDEHVG